MSIVHIYNPRVEGAKHIGLIAAAYAIGSLIVHIYSYLFLKINVYRAMAGPSKGQESTQAFSLYEHFEHMVLWLPYNFPIVFSYFFLSMFFWNRGKTTAIYHIGTGWFLSAVTFIYYWVYTGIGFIDVPGFFGLLGPCIIAILLHWMVLKYFKITPIREKCRVKKV